MTSSSQGACCLRIMLRHVSNVQFFTQRNEGSIKSEGAYVLVMDDDVAESTIPASPNLVLGDGAVGLL